MERRKESHKRNKHVRVSNSKQLELRIETCCFFAIIIINNIKKRRRWMEMMEMVGVWWCGGVVG
jgi:hypothetical protein